MGYTSIVIRCIRCIRSLTRLLIFFLIFFFSNHRRRGHTSSYWDLHFFATARDLSSQFHSRWWTCSRLGRWKWILVLNLNSCYGSEIKFSRFLSFVCSWKFVVRLLTETWIKRYIMDGVYGIRGKVLSHGVVVIVLVTDVNSRVCRPWSLFVHSSMAPHVCHGFRPSPARAGTSPPQSPGIWPRLRAEAEYWRPIRTGFCGKLSCNKLCISFKITAK